MNGQLRQNRETRRTGQEQSAQPRGANTGAKDTEPAPVRGRVYKPKEDQNKKKYRPQTSGAMRNAVNSRQGRKTVGETFINKRRGSCGATETEAPTKKEPGRATEEATFEEVEAQFEEEKAKYEALLEVQFIQPGETVGTQYYAGRDIEITHHDNNYIYDEGRNINVANILSQITNQTWTANTTQLADELENISAEIKRAVNYAVIERRKAEEAERLLHEAAKELRKPKPNLIGILIIIHQVIILIAKTKRLIGMGADLIMAYLAIRWLLGRWRQNQRITGGDGGNGLPISLPQFSD